MPGTNVKVIMRHDGHGMVTVQSHGMVGNWECVCQPGHVYLLIFYCPELWLEWSWNELGNWEHVSWVSCTVDKCKICWSIWEFGRFYHQA